MLFVFLCSSTAFWAVLCLLFCAATVDEGPVKTGAWNWVGLAFVLVAFFNALASAYFATTI